jgi:sec-independent protein translocase protein TatA
LKVVELAFGGFMGEGLFQPFHILLIIAIALLLFGPAKFASLGKGLGEGIRNFKSAIKEGSEEKKEEKTDEKKS